MILTNGSVMFNLSVLSNAPLCALPIKQNKKNPSGKINHCKWQRVQSDAPIARSLFFILHIYNPSFAELFNNVSHVLLFFYMFTLPATHSYIHTFIHPVTFYGQKSQKQSIANCFVTKRVIICPSCSVSEKEQTSLRRNRIHFERRQLSRLPTNQHFHEELELQRRR